ncbi:autophagocytosis associated protein [Syncephalis pseudoplumigaleata]|uniref:Autophagy-related protein 3 n=1 Tax=Syncephalis pseudoplumigaleata TaxID=1712513 RepID=A0A4P9Z572_9FUNG|nr:autophagocytosis associated protein [Syncephalis pseudoplumigaleata]|eukprot:RKP27764.1 autophagocytosis associated protein [Syncephalis pseudoplumigaleata]
MNVQNLFHSVREYLNPVLKESKFRETGVLTPEEFVAAGDFLVYKCPTWQWSAGCHACRRDYLPADKQFLITRNVPCVKRAKDMEYVGDDEKEIFDIMAGDGDDANEDGEGWLATHTSQEAAAKHATAEGQSQNDNASTTREIRDIDDEEEEGEEGEEAAASLAATLKAGDVSEDNILRTRTYDLSITYDKYYQTPRVWLFGYDEQRRPLTAAQIFEDISQEHARKTVTIDPHPHMDISLASVHPCKHAEVMRRIIERTAESGVELRVDYYMIIFLKFLSAILPTIDYDYTMAMEG